MMIFYNVISDARITLFFVVPCHPAGWLHNMGQGNRILVNKIPKETRTSYSLHEPSEVAIHPQLLVRPFSVRSFIALFP
jgi:hypothetical protein